MTRRLILLCILSCSALAGCKDSLTTADGDASTVPQYAPGGVPGPPPWVVIPTPHGPPPGVPVPLPPQAGPPSFLSSIVSVGSGNNFSCALRSEGLVYCWGANGSGQLGDGSQAPSTVPVEVTGPIKFAQLIVGDLNACGLTAAGEAYCWGDNSQGQLGIGTTTPAQSRVPVAVGGGHTFRNLSIGLRTVCGIADDGATYCWGPNNSGVLGNGTIGGISSSPVAVSNSATLGFVSVSVGFLHACALNIAGEAYCWGAQALFGNGSSSINVPTPTAAASGANFSRIEAGVLYTCGLAASGAASCWGSNNPSGEMGIGSIGAAAFTPTPVVGGLSFASIDGFNLNSVIASTCAISNSNEAWCWGANGEGQLGAPSAQSCTFQGLPVYACSSSPVKVSGGLSFRALAVGLKHVCALGTTGAVSCWGDNSFGQLGNGTTTDSQTPVMVSGLKAEERIGFIVVTPPTPLMTLLGSTLQFAAQAMDEFGVPLAAQPAFTFSSSAPAVASISASGLATALTNGTTTITATAPDGITGRAFVIVNIINPLLAFQQAYVGNGGFTSDGVLVLGGLLSDEWGLSDTFPTRNEVDRRSIAINNITIDQAFTSLATARVALEFEAARLQSVSPSDPKIGQLHTLAGFIYLAYADNFCSGVPLDDPNVGLSTFALFGEARMRFDRALAGPIDPAYALAARVGDARAKLGIGDPAAAATASALVPTPFLLSTTHSALTTEQNGIFALNTGQRRITLAEAEGGNGLPFRSALDPRVQWVAGGIGFNGVTPLFNLLKYPSATTPVELASGREARLIEAEAMLSAGNVAGFLAHLNSLRAMAGLAPVVDPGTPAARIDLLFRERAFWLFATGHRLGDLRRLIAQYGRSPANLFPVGAYPFPSATYGTDANLPVPASARGAAYSGCTNRTS